MTFLPISIILVPSCILTSNRQNADRSSGIIFQETNINAEFASRITYPDPFKPTGIEFDLPEDAHVTLTLFDHVGSELSTLITNELFKAGTHTIDFTAKGYNRGTYFYRLSIVSGGKSFTDTKRIVIES